jgi:hypothetical protein
MSQGRALSRKVERSQRAWGDRPELTGPDVKLVYAARSSFAGVILGRVASGAGGR